MQDKHVTPIVIKVGGSFFATLQNDEQFFFQTLAKLQSQHRPVVLVHGGGEQVLTRMKSLGIESVRRNGLRVTPDEHMPIVSSVLAGELNKQLVAHCGKYAINATGISLADGDIAICKQHPDDIGAVGLPSPLSKTVISALLSANSMPIVASIGRDDTGRLYNVNADHAAICIAQLLDASLYFFADVKGVLDGDKNLISTLTPSLCEKLIEQGVITDGMVVKVKAAQDAANQIGREVTIASWDEADNILLPKNTSDNQYIQICGTKVLPNTETKRAFT